MLGFKPNISWLVRQTSAEDVDQFKSPSELTDANSILASDILIAIKETIDTVEALIAGIETCLRVNHKGPLTFDDYLKARENGPFEDVAAFNAYHNNSIEGSVQAEVYSALLDVQDDLGYFETYVRDIFFDGDLVSVEELTKRETANLGARMVMAIRMPDSVDKLALAIEAKLKGLSKERIENIQEFISETQKTMSSALVDQFGEHTKDAVGKLITATESTLSVMKTMTELKIANLAKRTGGIQTRLKVIDNKKLHQDQLAKVKKLTQLRLRDTRNIMPWLKNLASEKDSEIYNPFISCFTESMIDIDCALDDVFLDISRMNQLDKLNRQDLLSNLEEKKAIRQIHHLLSSIEKHLDRSDDPVRQTRRLVENLDLEKPGNICSQ